MHLAAYLCRTWNWELDASAAAAADDEVQSLRVWYYHQTTMDNYRITKPQKRLLWEETC